MASVRDAQRGMSSMYDALAIKYGVSVDELKLINIVIDASFVWGIGNQEKGEVEELLMFKSKGKMTDAMLKTVEVPLKHYSSKYGVLYTIVPSFDKESTLICIRRFGHENGKVGEPEC